jgi:hypothetical protein
MEPSGTNRKTWKRILSSRSFRIVVLLALAAGVAWWWYGRTYTIRISPETTYLTEPLRPDGTVDYIAACNARLSKGVTANNNAAIPLFKAIGPGMLDPKTLQITLDYLGLQLPANGKYFVPWPDFATANPSSTTMTASGNDPEEPSEAMSGLWTAGECPRLAKFLDLNRAPLDLVVQASRRERFYVPWLPSKPNGRFIDWAYNVPLQQFLSLSRTLLARASGRFAVGDFQNAWQDMLTCHRLARLLGQHGSLIATMVSYSVDANAGRIEEKWLSSGKLTQPQARTMLSDLQALPPLQGVRESLCVGERIVVLDFIGLLATEGIERGLVQVQGFKPGPSQLDSVPAKPERSVDWNQAMIQVNAHFDRLDHAVSGSTWQARKKAMDDIEADMQQTRQAHQPSAPAWLGKYLPSSVTDWWQLQQLKSLCRDKPGDFIMGVLGGSFGRAVEVEQKAMVRSQLVQVALALEICKLQKGKYPADLSALTPEYFKAVPLDPFTDKPLLYKPSAKGFLIYSGGPNAKDDGGVERGKGGEDDIAVQVGPAQENGK